jgi:hypothetical protein
LLMSSVPNAFCQSSFLATWPLGTFAKTCSICRISDRSVSLGFQQRRSIAYSHTRSELGDLVLIAGNLESVSSDYLPAHLEALAALLYPHNGDIGKPAG